MILGGQGHYSVTGDPSLLTWAKEILALAHEGPM